MKAGQRGGRKEDGTMGGPTYLNVWVDITTVVLISSLYEAGPAGGRVCGWGVETRASSMVVVVRTEL